MGLALLPIPDQDEWCPEVRVRGVEGFIFSFCLADASDTSLIAGFIVTFHEFQLGLPQGLGLTHGLEVSVEPRHESHSRFVRNAPERGDQCLRPCLDEGSAEAEDAFADLDVPQARLAS